MKYYIYLLLTFLIQYNGTAQESKILNGIVQYKHADYTLFDENNVHLKYKFKVQILTPKGKEHGYVRITKNRDTKLKSFKAVVKDALGNKVYSASKSDLQKVDIWDYFTLYSDDKTLYKELNYDQYPYTVEYEYELIYNVFLGCYFYCLEDYGVSTEEAQLTIRKNKGVDFLYKANRFEGTLDSVASGDIQIYSWKGKNIQAIYRENYAPIFRENIPSVFITPLKINYNGYTATLDSWKNYGSWTWNLLQDRNILPEETRKTVLQLTETEPDTLMKIRILYKYLQETTRYVSVQDGIGGFQPFPATHVDKNKYGDCKGLSNYMNALLSVIGINGIYTEIGNGNCKITYEDFPSFNQTNHVIIAIPLNKDTVWLECTSKDIPFGFIGKSNSDRKGLAVTPHRGKLVNTPVYSLEQNYSTMNATMVISENGSMTCNAHYLNSGIMMEELIGLKSLDKKEKEHYLQGRFPSGDLSIKTLAINETNDRYPLMTFDLEFDETEFATKTGSLLSFTPNYLKRYKNYFLSSEERMNDIYISYSFQQLDTIRIILPDGYTIEHLPGLKNLTTEFGEFSTRFIHNEDQILYIRHFKMFKGTYPKDNYNAFSNFFRQVQATDQQKILLKKR